MTSVGDAPAKAPRRTRDPARKEKILDAAAGLVASNGFHAVSMAHIGESAGITGSGIYRHFDSKAAILVALFEQVIDDLLEDGRSVVEGTDDLAEALGRLVDGQVAFVVDKRELAQVYHNEIHNLPPEDQVRLRRKQRMYIEEWVHLLRELAPGQEDADVRALVHAAIAAIQSALFHNVGLPLDEMRRLLRESGLAVLRLART